MTSEPDDPRLASLLDEFAPPPLSAVMAKVDSATRPRRTTPLRAALLVAGGATAVAMAGTLVAVQLHRPPASATGRQSPSSIAFASPSLHPASSTAPSSATAPATPSAAQHASPAPTAPASHTTPSPVPSASGSQWPTAQSTGVPAGTSLQTVTGLVSLNQAGATYSNKLVNGCLDISAANVHVTNVIVRSTGGCGPYSSLVAVGHGLPGTTFSSVELDGTDGSRGDRIGQTWGFHGDLTCDRCNIHNLKYGGEFETTGTVSNSFVHTAGGVRCDGGGHNYVYLHNVIDDPGVADAAVDCGSPGISGLTIQNNLLSGGGSYTIYAGSPGNTPGQYSTNVVITGNHFTKQDFPKGGQFGYVTFYDGSAPGAQWSGNVWEETGATVPPA